MKSNNPETSFEEHVERLEAIVRTLETGDTSLEESLQLFEEGIALARALKKQLDDTEKRIEQILEDDKGNLHAVVVEMDDEA